MSAAVRIDRIAWTDPRFATLAMLIGKDRYSAIGRMAHIWGECTERHTNKLSAALVAGILEVKLDEAGAILAAAELGEALPDGLVRLRGCEGRIEWLAERREAARRGGEASAKVRAARKTPPKTRKQRAPEQPLVNQTSTNDQPSTNQTASNPQANANPPDSGLCTTGSYVSVPTEPTQPAPPPAKAPVHEFIGWFTERFQAHHAGAKPTWDPKSTGKVKRLLGLHGLDELKRRADVMFAMAPKFPATNPSVTTLERGIDDFAGPNATGPPGRVGHFKVTDDVKYAGGEVKL